MSCKKINRSSPSSSQRRLEKWVAKAKHKHGNRFDYTRVSASFSTQKSPEVCIHCKEHGDFWTTPDKHVQFQNGGCVACGKAAKSKAASERYRDEYVQWLQKSLPDHLSVVSEFIAPNAPISVKCKKHETVKETSAVYLKNNKLWGCDACAREATNTAVIVTLSDIKNDLELALPEGITLLGTESGEKGPILFFRCEVHGDFSLRKGTAERAKYFCPKCAHAKSGYAGQKLERLITADETGEKAWIAVMEVEVFGINSLKVGVTTRSLEQRYQWYLKSIFFKVLTTERIAYTVEYLVHKEFYTKHDRRIFHAGMRNGKRWAGDTETYFLSARDEIIEFLIKSLDEASKGKINEAALVSEIASLDTTHYQNREKDLSNVPVPVVGLDPKTGEKVVEFSSLSEASRAGYRNVSLVLNPESPRKSAGGLKWVRAD